jgi:hypothetical protein
MVEVLGVFASQTGQSLDARIAGWERYLSTRGNSPYADVIRRDVETLRDLRDQMRATSAPKGTEVVATVKHQAREKAFAGKAMPLVFVLDQPDRVASAFLHYRAPDARTYKRLLLVPTSSSNRACTTSSKSRRRPARRASPSVLRRNRSRSPSSRHR